MTLAAKQEAKPEPPLVLASGIEEVPHCREPDGGGLLLLPEMEEDRDRRGGEAEEEPRVEEPHQVSRAPCTNA